MAFGAFKGSLVGGTNSITNPLPATGSVSVAIGDLIVAVIAQQTANTSTAVTDNLTNTYTAQNAGTLATISGRMYYARAAAAGTLTTVNFSTTASTNDASCAVAVYEGPFTDPPIDRSPANLSADTTSPYSCPASTTLSQANELIIGWFAAASTATYTAGGGFTKNVQQSQSANASTSIASLVVSATTAQTPTWTGVAPAADVLGTASFKRRVFLSADTGAAAFSLKPAGIAYSRLPLVASVGTFASSLKDATLTYGSVAASVIQVSWAEVSGVEATAAVGAYTLTADTGAVTLAGSATGLSYHQTATLVASLGTFALAGPATVLRVARRTAAAVGAFTASFQPTNLVYAAASVNIQVSWAEVSGVEGIATGPAAYTLTADKGTFSLTGFATGLVYSHKLSMPAATGVFTLANPLTALRTARRLVAVTGVFALAGQATALRIGRALVAVKGTFTLAGPVTRLAATRSMLAVKGSTAFTFWAASLSKAGSYAVLASSYALAFTRVDANLRTIRKIAAALGTFALSGKVTALRAARRAVALTGALTFSGQPVNLPVKLYRKMTADTGAFALTGSDTRLAVTLFYKLGVSVGQFVLGGSTTALSRVYRLDAQSNMLMLVSVGADLIHHSPHPVFTVEPSAIVVSGNVAGLYVERNPWAFGQPGKLNIGRKMYAIPGRW